MGSLRIGNLLVPNDNYCKFEDWLMPILGQMVDEQDTQVREGTCSAGRGPSGVTGHLGRGLGVPGCLGQGFGGPHAPPGQGSEPGPPRVCGGRRPG